jgi:hypothetical protein
MTKLVVALALAAACGARSEPPVEPTCTVCPPAPPSCRRGKWQRLMAEAIERTRPSSQQIDAIVDWYCARDIAAPHGSAVTLAIDGNAVPVAEFWSSAKHQSYELNLGSSVRVEPVDDADRPAVATRVTVATNHDRWLAAWIDFDFSARDELVGVNLGQGSACPFVATSFDGGPFVEHGTILTNLHAATLEATQSLALAGPAACHRVVVRVTEREPETTYLDAIAIAIDGTRVVPASCPGAAYCSDDGVYHRLERGERIDVELALPPGTDCSALRVLADGYYVPRAGTP